MAEREWLTQGEVKAVIHEVMNSELRDTLDKLRDGAQASINTALLLHGDPSIGVKGALPDMQEQIGAVKTEVHHLRETTSRQHSDNIKRLDALEESDRRRKWLRRTAKSIFEFASKKNSRLTVMWGSIALAAHWIIANVFGLNIWKRVLQWLLSR